MNQLAIVIKDSNLPALVTAAGPRAATSFLEFFAPHIRNPNTRRASDHNLETYLHAYLDGTGIALDAKGPLFRTIDRKTRHLSRRALPQANAYAMIQRRAAAACIATKIGNHTFRATGITAYLKNGGTLERAASMANHSSTRTTQLYERRPDEVTLDEVERVLI